MSDRNAFLTRTAMFMVFYVALWVGIAFCILIHPDYARVMWISMQMNIFFWVYALIAFLVKCVASFFGPKMRRFMKVLYLIDCIFSALAYFGSFYFFDNILPNAYQYSGHYVIMCSFLFCSTALGFLFSTLCGKKGSHYNWFFGLLLMSLFNGINIIFFVFFYPIETMKSSRCVFFICGFGFLILK